MPIFNTKRVNVTHVPAETLETIQAEGRKIGILGEGPACRHALVQYVRLLKLARKRRLDPLTLLPRDVTSAETRKRAAS